MTASRCSMACGWIWSPYNGVLHSMPSRFGVLAARGPNGFKRGQLREREHGRSEAGVALHAVQQGR